MKVAVWHLGRRWQAWHWARGRAPGRTLGRWFLGRTEQSAGQVLLLLLEGCDLRV